MNLAILSATALLSLLLLPLALWQCLAGRNRRCATTIAAGLLATAVAILGGFGALGAVDTSVSLGVELPPVVLAKIAIGLGLLHFAVGWVTVLARVRPAAASLGFLRTRAVARPRTIPMGYNPSANPVTGPRPRPKTRTAIHVRPSPPSAETGPTEPASAR